MLKHRMWNIEREQLYNLSSDVLQKCAFFLEGMVEYGFGGIECYFVSASLYDTFSVYSTLVIKTIINSACWFKNNEAWSVEELHHQLQH